MIGPPWQEAERELVYDRGAPHYEANPVDLSVDDLDQDQLASYAQAIGASSIEHAPRTRPD